MELVEVRCPFRYVSKSDNKEYPCNRVCVRVHPGSSGEAQCRFCRKNDKKGIFSFQVGEQDERLGEPQPALVASGGSAS